jgi:hypothetical protein
MERPHANVHEGTKRVFNLLQQSAKDYPALLQALKEMEESSHQVFVNLDRIQQERKNQHRK